MKRLFLLLCLLLSVEVQALARTPLMPVDNLKAGMRADPGRRRRNGTQRRYRPGNERQSGVY